MVEFQIAFPSNSCFDDRRLRIKDDGFDFERFVFRHDECSTMKKKEIRAGIGRGRDAQLTFSCTTLMRNSWLSVSLSVRRN